MKKEFIINFLFFLLLLASSQANATISNPYLLLVLTIIFVAYTGKKVNYLVQELLIALLVLLFFCIGSLVLFGQYSNPTFIIRVICYIIVAFGLINYYGIYFFFLYEKYIFRLTIVSLFFYIMMVMNFSATYSIVKSIEGFIGVEAIELQQFKKFFVSIYIYTINENDMHVFPLRNCGFAYEPGYFAGFIVFAVLVNVLRSKILFNRNFIVLVLGLITTVSTTGFIAFIAILAFYGFAKRIKYRVIIIPFVFVLIYYIINLDFMYSKVTELVLNQDKNTDMVLNAGATGQSLGRFAGLTFNLSRVLSESPIFGFFAQDSRIYGESIIAPNGFGVFILRFGFLGLIFFIWGLFKSSKKVIPLFTHSKYSLIYVIVASVWMFSFNQLFNVVFYVIFLYGFFKVPNQIKNNLA